MTSPFQLWRAVCKRASIRHNRATCLPFHHAHFEHILPHLMHECECPNSSLVFVLWNSISITNSSGKKGKTNSGPVMTLHPLLKTIHVYLSLADIVPTSFPWTDFVTIRANNSQTANTIKAIADWINQKSRRSVCSLNWPYAVMHSLTCRSEVKAHPKLTQKSKKKGTRRGSNACLSHLFDGPDFAPRRDRSTHCLP